MIAAAPQGRALPKAAEAAKAAGNQEGRCDGRARNTLDVAAKLEVLRTAPR